MKSSTEEIRIFKHNDMADLKSKLDEVKKNGLKNGKQPNKVLVIVEGLYSMEGEFCKLKEIIALKKIYGFYLYVDEAHSIGCLGPNGRGIVDQLGCSFDDVDILMGTFSKSFASAGGYIASDKKTISFLRNNSYSWVYGNPMSPVAAQQIISCLEMIQLPEGKRKIAQLKKNSIDLRTRFIDAGCHVLGDLESPVIPVMIYHPAKIKDISRICLQNGVAIVVVGYPACPIDACRIRFCVSAGHTPQDIEKGFKVTMDAMRQTDCIFQDTAQPSSLQKANKLTLAEIEKIPKNPRNMIPLSENIEQKYFENEPEPETIKENELNICTYDIHNFEKDEKRQERLINIIKEYGCGSCGPRNFYGGTMEHVTLEDEIKKFYDTDEAIIISYGHNLMSSVVPVFAKPGNVVLVDELCNYPIQLGCRLGKAKVIKYKHNNINDLEQKLNEAKNLINSSYSLITIVTEGVFQHDYSLAPLKEIVNLKKSFLENNRKSNLYIIVDDSLGIGNIGPNLKGSLDYAYLNLKDDIDIVCGSFEFCMNSVGGFLAGNINKIYKCRLFAAGYIFSASSPPYSCTAAKDSFERIEKNGKKMKEALDVIKKEFRKKMTKVTKVEIVGNVESSCLLLKCENVDNVVNNLRKEGFYVVRQFHLKEDWCQNKYIKVNLGKWFDSQTIDKFVNALAKF